MHFIEAGSGHPPLLFVHGFACSLEDWKHQTSALAASHHVIACDLRGHGKTPGRPHECTIEHYGGDVAALINNLELRGVVLVGHSMGCRVVLEANRLVPKRVGGLVLIDGSRIATGDPAAAEAAARAVTGAGYPAFAENLFRQMFFKPSAEADAIVARALRQSAEFGPDLWPRLARWDAQSMDAALAAVRCPLMTIQSTTRNTLTMKRAPMEPGETNPYLELLKSKGARVEIVPDTGHFAMLEAPERVNRLIEEFCR